MKIERVRTMRIHIIMYKLCNLCEHATGVVKTCYNVRLGYCFVRITGYSLNISRRRRLIENDRVVVIALYGPSRCVHIQFVGLRFQSSALYDCLGRATVYSANGPVIVAQIIVLN